MFDYLVGQTLGKYELRALLGTGGMGAVYRAYDHSLQREIAVKVINLGASNDELQGRFIREARTEDAFCHHPQHLMLEFSQYFLYSIVLS